MPTGTLEERLTAVEEKVAQLTKRLEEDSEPKANPWLEQVFGVFKDDPLFEEAVRYGREWRALQDTGEDEEADVPA